MAYVDVAVLSLSIFGLTYSVCVFREKLSQWRAERSFRKEIEDARRR